MDSKYIIIYGNSSNERDQEIIIKLSNKFNFKIYFFLQLSDATLIPKLGESLENFNKPISGLEEIVYVDDFTEDIYINEAEFIFCLNNLYCNFLSIINIIKKYNKENIFYDFTNLNNLDDLDDFQNSEKYKYNGATGGLLSGTLDQPSLELAENSPDLLSFGSSASERLSKFNINLVIKKNNVIKNGIIMITYFIKSDKKILDIIQKKCIIENLKNTNVEKMMVIGNNLEEEFKDTDILNHPNIFIYQYEENISFHNLIDFASTFFENKIICILRSDIILLNQITLNDLELDLLLDKNQVFALSRIERLINGNLVKCDKLNKLLYCTEQDAWIFKSPLKLNLEKNLNIDLNKIYFYDKNSHLFLNKVLKDNDYNIINNSKKYKIIRILHENNLDSRLLYDNNSNITNLDTIYLLPDNEILEKITFEQLLNMVKVDENELYKIKCDIFDKYLKNKIFKI